MSRTPPRAHPYMASSNPQDTEAMMQAVGVETVDELFDQIPPADLTRHAFRLPDPIVSEVALDRHLRSVLSANQHTASTLTFLGGGCWPHYVPAVCDEIVGRSEFSTNVWGTTSSDHGRGQVWFEFASMLGDLLEMDFVGLPVYSWGCAVGSALRMAARATGRQRVLVPASLDAERRAVVGTYCQPAGTHGYIEVVEVGYGADGCLDLGRLAELMDDDVAALYLETPGSFGVVERGAVEAFELAHRAGALAVAGVDPLSLGVLASPAALGADIATGPLQPLGVPMAGGGGCGGFLASLDTEELARTFPTLQVSAARTNRPDELGFSLTLFAQSSYGARELGNDWTGNSVYLWTAANAAYMALLGPDGFREVGETILHRSHAAARALSAVDGVDLPFGADRHFKEFVVTFRGRTVAEVNDHLLSQGIFGGHDVGADHPDLGNAALYCVTEVHTDEDVQRLVAAVAEAVA
jgi:glycine dehydrogenase subunit 1